MSDTNKINSNINNEINSTLSFLNNLPAYYKMSFKMTHIVFQQQLLFTEHQMPLNLKFPERTTPTDHANNNNNKESASKSSNNKSNNNSSSSSKKAKAKPKKTTSTSTTTTIATSLSELDELNGGASGSSQFEQYEVELTTLAEPTVDNLATPAVDISASPLSPASSSSSSQPSIYSYSLPSIYLGQVSFVDNRLNLPLFNSLVKTTFGEYKFNLIHFIPFFKPHLVIRNFFLLKTKILMV